MVNLTKEQIQSTYKIVEYLAKNSSQMNESERVRYIYNNAIDDACEFANNLADRNPRHKQSLISLSNELRNWLTLPDSE